MATFKMGKMVFRSLFKKPATLMYPVIPREYHDNTRGHIDIDVDNCILCGICQKKCPANAITVDRAKKSWVIQRMQCVQCSACVVSCPKKCLTNANTYTTPNTEKVVDTFTVPIKEKPKAVPKASANAGSDGEIKCNLETCIYCGICQKKCPSEAITVDRPGKTWKIDKSACVLCNVCVDACPKKSLTNE